jgi:DNA-binding NarL/FixJ family response regulator
MRVLIVDDEPPARARLQRLLETAADIEVVGTAQDGEDALRQVAACAPEAVFLEVQMRAGACAGAACARVRGNVADPRHVCPESCRVRMRAPRVMVAAFVRVEDAAWWPRREGA